MPYYQLQNWKAQTEVIEQVISRMRLNINKYAERQNANQDYVTAQKEIITKLYNYLQNTISLVNEYEQEISKEYNRGFNACKEREANKGKPNRFYDREAARYYSINKLKTEMPNLF